MEKRYLCFTCYQYHPEMRGISEEEFNNGSTTCQEEKCTCRGEELKPAKYCQQRDGMFPFED